VTTPAPSARFLDAVRPEAREAPESGIVEVFNYGRGRQGLIPLWVGEGDLPTPDFVRDAAKASLDQGETFYTWQRGLPELRQAIADYMTRTYGAPFAGAGAFGPERFFVTTGGMHAIQIALRLVCGLGDEVIVPTPAWPNFPGALLAAGARPIEAPMRRAADAAGRPGKGKWTLDLDLIETLITPRARAIIVNSPSNPTGWTATGEEIEAVLALARKHGLWIVADEIYGRFFYAGARAPSFHDHMDENDRVLFVQTLSKNWAMTGWRVGWLEAPAQLGQAVENLIQYSTSGSPVFAQRGALAALTQGDAFVEDGKRRADLARHALAQGLRATGRVDFGEPDGAFYLFAHLEGFDDTRALALRLVDEAGVGVAPGSAFGAGGAPYLRICYARDPADVAEVAARMARWIGRPA
jgi:aspartate/methionine/tyrosine aminotransferase